MKDRLLSKIRIDDASNCWNWTGTRSSSGYGRIKVNKRWLQASRVSYEVHKGQIPIGMSAP